VWDFHSWYKKASNAKKESYCSTEPVRLLPNLPLRPGKQKKKIQVFLSRQFCALLPKGSYGKGKSET